MPFFLGKDEIHFKIISQTNKEENYQHLNSNIEIPTKDNVLTQRELFVFNPNTITLDDAQKIGFSKKLSLTLIKFRLKGGKFYKAEDLKKIYGMSSKLYTELEPYILIPSGNKSFKPDSIKSVSTFLSERKWVKKELLELNTADSATIIKLNGVGPGYTKRIMKYRSLLGGFHSMNQLKEIYGMTDSLYEFLTSQVRFDIKALSMIPINVIDFNSLRKHPYFNFQTAQAIINYRSKHGKLKEDDIKSLGVFNEDKLMLILPYLDFR